MSAARDVRVSVLGPFRAEVAGNRVVFPSAPARTLLAILVLSEELRETRTRIGTLLWEDADEQQVRRRLRQALYALRTALGPARDAVGGDRATLVLDPTRVASDLGEIETALAQGKVPDALLDCEDRSGNLLLDLPEPGKLFASWLVLRRRVMQTRFVEALRRIVRDDATAEGARAARALLALDASDELAVRYLVSHHAGAGEIGKALQIYSDLWTHLDEHYGMEPSEATQALIARVKLGADATPEPVDAGPATIGRAVRLAIPSVMLHAGDEMASQVAALFRSELIGRLSRFREIEVLDGALKPDVPADYRLGIAVSAPADTTRLLATLSDAGGGRVLRSDSFEELTTDWLGKIITVAGSVCAACNLGISRSRLAELRRGGPTQRAFDHWLMGQMLLDEFRATSWDGATRHFSRAIEVDPYFSGAYSSLSQVRNIRHLVHPGFFPDPTDLKYSRDLANRAISLDPEDSRAHLCRAWSSLLLGEYAFAEGAFADALDCNPDDPWTVISSALGAAFGGDLPRALELAERTIAQRWSKTPSIWGYLATIRFLSGDYEACVAAAENAGTAILNIPAWKAAAFQELGAEQAAATAWGAFEAATRAHWAGEGAPDTGKLLDWFRACFPIRRHADRQRLHRAAERAARGYLHCMQR
jgi:DNA-binding SARP family transcriptional activator